MVIIKERKRITVTNYDLTFEWNNRPGCGFSFECDKDGNIQYDKMPKAALDNLNGCICGEYNVRFTGVQENMHRYTEPAVGRCSCGEKVQLAGFTNTCGHCGADYNLFGQRLAHRSQWGEETGESLSDILLID